MSSTESISDSSYTTEDSDYDFLPQYEIQDELERASVSVVIPEQRSDANDIQTSGPYADEPIASAEWLANYEREKKEEEERRQELENRLKGLDVVANWCSCGKCDIRLLQKVYECRCCTEIEQCVAALNSDLVLQEVEIPPSCITLHPGFQSVCLDKWALRMSAGKYKTRDRRRYRQNGSEEAFFRSVAYREFSQLVYGLLGHIRNPLPACAYAAIRDKFNIEEEDFKGFEFEEDE